VRFLSEHFAEHAAQALADELTPTEASKSYIAFRPLGVMFGVQPCNGRTTKSSGWSSRH
jgi:succinate-semialdehyde dehydrogenase/glutarate-semialdehyde dehydrogenase